MTFAARARQSRRRTPTYHGREFAISDAEIAVQGALTVHLVSHASNEDGPTAVAGLEMGVKRPSRLLGKRDCSQRRCALSAASAPWRSSREAELAQLARQRFARGGPLMPARDSGVAPATVCKWAQISDHAPGAVACDEQGSRRTGSTSSSFWTTKSAPDSGRAPRRTCASRAQRGYPLREEACGGAQA